MIVSLKHSFQQITDIYVEEIPSNTRREATIGFFQGFFWHVVLSGSVGLGVAGGVAAVTATVIHALVTPLLKPLIGDRLQLTWGEAMLRSSTAIFSTTYLSARLGYSFALRRVPFSLLWEAGINIFESYRQYDEIHRIIP